MAPPLRQHAPRGRMRACAAGVGGGGPLVPAERLAAAAEALEGLAGDHVTRRRVGVRPVGLLHGPPVEGRGGILVAAHLRPGPALQQEHGVEGLHLRQAFLNVAAHRPQHEAWVVPHGPRPVHHLVAYVVQVVRRVEQLRIPLERALHAQLALDRPHVVDALDGPVGPEQVGRIEARHGPCNLWNVSRRDAQVKGGVLVQLGVEPVAPDLAVEQL